MTVEKNITKQRTRRLHRVRNSVRRAAKGRHRLSVFRSNKHIYAQIIDDTAGNTVASASSLDGAVVLSGKTAGNKEAATKVGTLIAQRALENNVTRVVFDRGVYQYHGRVAALADAAREAGLEF